MEAFHPAFFAQQAGLILPSAIMMLKNDEDRQFVTELYLQYRELMYVVARRYFGDKEMDIEDAISIAVERMCRYIDSFRGIEQRKLKSYMYSVIENACREQFEQSRSLQSKNHVSTSTDDIEDIADPEDPYATVFDRADAISLLESFKGLSDRERELIRMRHIDGEPFSEIARKLGLTENSVRGSLSRARKHLCELASKRRGED